MGKASGFGRFFYGNNLSINRATLYSFQGFLLLTFLRQNPLTTAKPVSPIIFLLQVKFLIKLRQGLIFIVIFVFNTKMSNIYTSI